MLFQSVVWSPILSCNLETEEWVWGLGFVFSVRLKPVLDVTRHLLYATSRVATEKLNQGRTGTLFRFEPTTAQPRVHWDYVLNSLGVGDVDPTWDTRGEFVDEE